VVVHPLCVNSLIRNSTIGRSTIIVRLSRHPGSGFRYRQPASIDSAAMTAALLGPLYYRRCFSREPLDDKFVKGVINNAIGQRAPN
jgi:hypothetical protein